jgi:hypothetical protein
MRHDPESLEALTIAAIEDLERAYRRRLARADGFDRQRRAAGLVLVESSRQPDTSLGEVAGAFAAQLSIAPPGKGHK